MGRWIERNGKAQPRCHRYIELAIACKSMYIDFYSKFKLVFDIEMWKLRSIYASKVVLDCEW